MRQTVSDSHINELIAIQHIIQWINFVNQF